MNLGEKIIDFNLFGVDGSYFSVSNIDNEKKIVVFFTCNHCPYVHDTDQKIAKLYDASHTPHFFVFSKKILIYKGKFDDNWSDKSKVAKTYLEDSIKNTSFNPQDTFPVGCTIKWR